MPHFFAEVSGSSGQPQVTHGSKTTGVQAQVRGWDVGVMVEGSADGQVDLFHVYANKGSHEPNVRQLLATVEYGPDGYRVTIYNPQHIEAALSA